MSKAVTCDQCNSILKNRASYRTHKSSFHRNENHLNSNGSGMVQKHKAYTHDTKAGRYVLDKDGRYLYHEDGSTVIALDQETVKLCKIIMN